MTTLPNSAEECNAIPPAYNNVTAFAENDLSKKTISNKGGDKVSKTPIYFSWDLAIKINPKQPDVLASLSIYGLYTWKPKSESRFSYAPKINGELACYRSTRELEQEYTSPLGSLATDTAILKALRRASKKLAPGFILDENVPTAHRGKLHYLVSDKLAKTYKFNLKKNNGLTKFYLEDAIKHDSILAGVLLANMDFQIETFEGALKDEDGNKYGELSPAKLTSKNKDGKIILPRHREVVGDAIRALKEDGAIIEHPTRKGFYRRGIDEVEVGSDEVEVSRREVEVSRRFAKKTRKPCPSNALQQIPKTSDRNTDSRPDRKCLDQNKLASLVVLNEASLLGNDGKNEMMNELIGHELITHEEIAHEESGHELFHHDNISPDMEGVASDVACNISAGGRILLNIFKNAPLKDIYAHHSLDPYAVYKVNDYDKVEFIGYDLPYDFIPLDPNTGKPYSRAAEIIYTVNDLKNDIIISGWNHPRPDELAALRQLFITHPSLTYEHVSELMKWCEPRVEPFYLGDWSAPKKGHDSLYWARRIKSLKAFLKYLPQIIKEWWRGTNEEAWNIAYDEYGDEHEWKWLNVSGEREYLYYGLTEPLLTIAFNNEPHLLKHYQLTADFANSAGCDKHTVSHLYREPDYPSELTEGG